MAHSQCALEIEVEIEMPRHFILQPPTHFSWFDSQFCWVDGSLGLPGWGVFRALVVRETDESDPSVSDLWEVLANWVLQNKKCTSYPRSFSPDVE